MASRPAPSGAILWLHDHGETNPAEFASHTKHHMPWLNIHCPAAPLKQFAGLEKPTHAWFRPPTLKGGDVIESPEGLSDSIKYVHERLDHLREAMRIDASRILIGGFGQGGALAVAAGLSYRFRIAGIACHSGYVCQPRTDLEYIRSAGAANREVPVMLIHGHDDETVDAGAATSGAAMLKAMGVSQVIHRAFEDVAHKMVPDTLSLLVDFVRSRLPVEAEKPKNTQVGNASAKSKSVIKMNGRSAAAPTHDSTEPQPSPAYAAGRKTETTDAFAVFANSKARSPPVAMPMVQELNGSAAPAAVAQPPKPSTRPAAVAAQPPKPSTRPAAVAPAPANKSATSADPATAQALEKGDGDALRKALEQRGDDSPLGEDEMLAIAKLFLGDEGNEDALAAMQDIAKQAAAGTKAPAKSADVDSDEEDEDDVTDVTDPAPIMPSPTPPLASPLSNNYELTDVDGALQLVISLPDEVTSMAQVDVEIGLREIEVSVEGRRLVKLPLAKDLCEDEARAKFAKKSHELRITVPYRS